MSTVRYMKTKWNLSVMKNASVDQETNTSVAASRDLRKRMISSVYMVILATWQPFPHIHMYIQA